MTSDSDRDLPISRRERVALAGFCALLLGATLLVTCTSCLHGDKRTLPTTSDPAIGRLMLGGTFRCTAWKVGEGLVMTAGHCCDAKQTYTMEGSHALPGAEYKVLDDDDDHDVCVLSGPMTGAPIRLAAFDPQVGAPVWTLGWPHGIQLVSSGYWSGRNNNDMGICSSTVGFGSSGSPVMDADGRAVGVISARYGDMDNLTIMATLEWMRDSLRRAYLAR